MHHTQLHYPLQQIYGVGLRSDSNFLGFIQSNVHQLTGSSQDFHYPRCQSEAQMHSKHFHKDQQWRNIDRNKHEWESEGVQCLSEEWTVNMQKVLWWHGLYQVFNCSVVLKLIIRLLFQDQARGAVFKDVPSGVCGSAETRQSCFPSRTQPHRELQTGPAGGCGAAAGGAWVWLCGCSWKGPS